MWVYNQVSPGIFEVGFYSPNGDWLPQESFTSQEMAATRVNYLNGGHNE